MIDSILSGGYGGTVTSDQVETARKLAVIGWRWNVETVQRGVLRLRNHVTFDLPGRHHLGSSLLIAEIHPDGAVLMGEEAGVAPKKKRA